MENLTCENYVVKRLMALESENETLKFNFENLLKSYTELQDKLDSIEALVKEYGKVKRSTASHKYFEMSLWNGYHDKESADYEQFLALLNIDDLEDEEEDPEEVLMESEEEENGTEE